LNRCENIRELIPLLIEDVASQDEHLRVKTHCKTCESCDSFYKDALAIRKLVDVEKIETPETYASELIVKLNQRIDENRIRHRIIWRAIPSFGALTAVILTVSIVMLNDIHQKNESITTLSETESTLAETFSEELSGVLNLSNSDDEYKTSVVRYVLEDNQQLPIDRIMLVSSAMDESEFESFVNELKSISL